MSLTHKSKTIGTIVVALWSIFTTFLFQFYIMATIWKPLGSQETTLDHKFKTFWNFYCNHFSIHIIFLRGKSHFKWPFLKMTGSKLSPYMQSLAASKWCFSVLKCSDIFQISDAQCALHTFFIPWFKRNIIISSVKFSPLFVCCTFCNQFYDHNFQSWRLSGDRNCLERVNKSLLSYVVNINN